MNPTSIVDSLAHRLNIVQQLENQIENFLAGRRGQGATVSATLVA